MNSPAPQQIEFRPVEQADLPLLAVWLAEPHVCRFYQQALATLEDVAREYGPAVRAEGPTIRHVLPEAGTRVYRP